MKTRPLWMFYAGCVCFAWVFKMVLNVVSPYLIGQIKGGGMFIRYNSPFIVGTAVALLLIFPGCIFIPKGCLLYFMAGGSVVQRLCAAL